MAVIESCEALPVQHREALPSERAEDATALPLDAPGADALRFDHSGVVPSGEGIGLSIVKRLCEVLGATVKFGNSSRLGYHI